MLRSRLVASILVLAVGVVAIAAAPAWFQEETPQDHQMVPATQEHKDLQKSAGTWKGTVQMFYPGASTEPVPATETVEAFGPYWVVTRFESNFEGMPFHGTATMGYDVEKQKYVGTWIDNTQPFLHVMEGTADEDTKTITMTWDARDMTGEMKPHRMVTVCTETEYTSTFYSGEGDEETKGMVIKMSKTKDAMRPGAGTTPAGATDAEKKNDRQKKDKPQPR